MSKKLKYAIPGVVVLAVLAFGVFFFWPAAGVEEQEAVDLDPVLSLPIMEEPLAILEFVIVSGADDGIVRVALTESAEAFQNPMKGFMPTRYVPGTGNPTFRHHEYGSTFRHYIMWRELENCFTDDVQKIIEWSDWAWADLPARNAKVVPRITLQFPRTMDIDSEIVSYWPDHLYYHCPVMRWFRPEFIDHLPVFIAKLGEAWNDDPRIAFIEMALWGNWGEHHIWPLTTPYGSERMPEYLQVILAEAFLEAFPDKKIQVRYPMDFRDFEFGFHWDSFALPDDARSGAGIRILNLEQNRWHTQIITGEIAYNWGDQSILGGSPYGTLSCNYATDYVIYWVEQVHASTLAWVSDYYFYWPVTEAVAYNAARLQKALGYRFVINNASYNRVVLPGEGFTVSFSLTNVGNAPFYYEWPVQVALLDDANTPVWTGLFDVDIRQWLPGRQIPVVTGEFVLPADLEPGVYTVALTVLNPAGLVPSLRFANTEYFIGGYTILGRMGVGVDLAPEDALVFGPFDSLKYDHSLFYVFER